MHTHTPPLKPQNQGARATQILVKNDPGEGGGGGGQPNSGAQKSHFSRWRRATWTRKFAQLFPVVMSILTPKNDPSAPPHICEFWIRILTKVEIYVPKNGTSGTHFFFRKKRTGRPICSGASVHFGPIILNRFLGPFWGGKTRVREGGEGGSKTLLIGPFLQVNCLSIHSGDGLTIESF